MKTEKELTDLHIALIAGFFLFSIFLGYVVAFAIWPPTYLTDYNLARTLVAVAVSTFIMGLFGVLFAEELFE